MSKQVSKIDDLRNNIAALGPQFKTALPAHVTVEKFSRVLMTAIAGNSQLQDANRTSLFASCMKLAAQGLLPDGREAAIVTFRTKNGVMAQAMPMMAGIMKLVRNSGEIATISPHVVYENDDFKYWIDELGEHLNHLPKMSGARGNVTHAYCVARTKDGSSFIEVMSKEDLDKVRNSSKSKDNGPWATWYGEMAKKTVFRRLSKRLPMSTDLDMAIQSEDEIYSEPPTQTDVTPEPEAEAKPAAKKTKPKKLADVIEASETEDEEVDRPAVFAPAPGAEDELPL